MAVSPRSETLYRTTLWVVTCAAFALGLGLLAHAQYEHRPKPDAGPRALGLLELAPNGKAHLIPIAIMYNGDFYDASAYKADPVPMALDSGTVYEAERTGVSQGLFTVSGALQDNNTFIGQGNWQDAAAIAAAAAAAKKRQPMSSEPRGIDDDSGPPRLVYRHPEDSTPAPASTAPPKTAPAQKPATPPTASSPTTSSPTASSPTVTSGPVLKVATPASSSAPSGEASDENDPNRPRLRRQESKGPVYKEDPEPTVKAAVLAEVPKAAQAANIQLIPAISDAGGPDPQPYTYPMKPDEEQQFRKNMLKMAAAEVQAYVKKWTAGPATSSTSASPRTRRHISKTAAKPFQPSFDNVQLHVFDLSASNEPVLVLSATAQIPPSAADEKNQVGPVLSVTLVARQDIYGDLQKVQGNVTDPQHLDAAPRMDLIDAVDADGDGRGELLFRETSDQGSGFAIYRVIGNQLYALFQSTPGE